MADIQRVVSAYSDRYLLAEEFRCISGCEAETELSDLVRVTPLGSL